MTLARRVRDRRIERRCAPRSLASSPGPGRSPVVFLALALVLGGAVVVWPLLAPLVLAAWVARLSRPLFRRFRDFLGGRARAAGVLTALFVLVALAPLALAVALIIPAARSMYEQLRHATGGKGALEALVSTGPTQAGASDQAGTGIVALAAEYGEAASKALAFVAGASVEVIIAAFVYFVAFYSLLVDGDRWWSWARAHAGLEPGVLERLANAFHQAGRGLLLGLGLTAAIQGALATAFYAAFGVPRALVLGMLSTVAALLPMTGPLIVWVPVCAGLALSGAVGKAIALAALCAGVVGTVDNVVRPWLSRRFDVGMPATLVLVGMLGGVVVLGASGLLLGPLVLRLAGEALRVCSERRLFPYGARTPGCA